MGILLGLALVLGLGLLPGMAKAAHADPIENYPLWVGGVQVTSANAGDVFNDGKVSYTPAATGEDPTPATLTLNGYAYSGDDHGVKYAGDGQLNIVLIGENTITSTGDNKDGINGGDNGILSFSGEGSLSVKSTSGHGGIFAEKDIIIKSGTVTAEGGTVTDERDSAGIFARGYVNITGGNVKASSTSKKGSGIRAGVCAAIEGGTVEATCNGEESNGIYSTQNITVSGGSVNASATGKKSNGIVADSAEGVTISGGAVKATVNGDDSLGIYAYNRVTIKSGTVEVTSTEEGSFGIMAEVGAVKIEGGEVTVNSDVVAIQSLNDSVEISDGTVNVSGGSVCGILANTGVAIDGGIVEAGGGGKYGIVVFDDNDVTIKGGRLTATGNTLGISGTVKNAIAGTGWTNVEGTEGEANIPVNADPGQELAYKKVQFPEVAKVTTAPKAKELAYDRKAQELVTAGEAEGGEMQYALGEDATTAPTSGWDKSVPKGTEAKAYHVWYKAKGDESHSDSEAKCVEAAIAKADVSKATVTLNPTSFTYDGKAKEPQVTVKLGDATLQGNADFTVKFSDNVEAGTATATVTGAGNYTGTAKATFTIEAAPEPGPKPEPGPEPSGDVVMHRLYNPWSYEHFYTSDDEEFEGLVALGWEDEGLGWVSPAVSDMPVFRLYNPYNGGDHHYTASTQEVTSLSSAGWDFEGVGWYSADESGTPVFREYNPNELARNHNYTTDEAEHDGLVALGWHDEEIAWYGVPSNDSGLQAASL